METRKIQMTGGSSYIVSLPKWWVKSSGLKKNDEINIIPKEDGSLLIFPGRGQKKIEKSKILVVNEDTSTALLFRSLVGSYMSGFSEIRIKSNTSFIPQIRREIIKFTKTAIGIEVVDEKTDEIVIKDLIDPKEIPLFKGLKRMYEISNRMHKDALESLFTGDLELIEDVVVRDSEIDRLYWLIAREYRMIGRQGEDMNVSTSTAMHSFLLARYMERIGDHGVRIAKSVKHLIKEDYHDLTVLNTINKGGKFALSIFKDAIDSFFSKNLEKANNTIVNSEKIVSIYKEILTHANNVRGNIAISLAYIAESIRRTGEYSVDIAEDTINYIMEDKTKNAL